MKSHVNVIVTLYITFSLSDSVSDAVKSCFICPDFLLDIENNKICKYPVKTSKLEHFDCSILDSMVVEVEDENKTEDATPETTLAESLVERVEEKKSDWHCYTANGVYNGAPVVSKGCAKNCSEIERVLDTAGEKCDECDTDNCNFSVRINPIELVFLLIIAICVGLDYQFE